MNDGKTQISLTEYQNMWGVRYWQWKISTPPPDYAEIQKDRKYRTKRGAEQAARRWAKVHKLYPEIEVLN